MMYFALALVVSAAGASVRPADGTYNFTGARDGVVFGRTVVTVSHSGTGVGIAESGTGTVEGNVGTAQATLTLASEDLSPTAYSSVIAGAGTEARSSLAFADATATLSGTAGTQTFNLLAGTTHFAVVDGALLDGFVALPAQLAQWNGAGATLIIPIYGQVSKLSQSAAAAPPRPAAVPAADASVTFGQPILVTEWYDPATFIPDEIDVPSLQLVISRVRS